ncbi:hypothetical protein [Acidovorax delafieldii]|uniref:hypothetical protein n=1 Tax=Acidovorax delafieldii TaxID=47920 RepID=UPI003ECE99F2
MNLAFAHTTRAPRASSGFVRAHDLAKQYKADGCIRDFRVDSCGNRGRVITLQNESGWSPYPLFVENPSTDDQLN